MFSGEKNQVRIAVEELFVNIASYAYSPETGTVTVRVKTETAPPETAPPSVTVTFVDAGVPFDPLKKQDPDIALSPLPESVKLNTLQTALLIPNTLLPKRCFG